MPRLRRTEAEPSVDPAAEENNGERRPTAAAPSPGTEDALARAVREHPGHWIAWNAVTRGVIALGNDYAAVMRQVPDPRDPHLVVDVAPGIHPAAAARRFVPLKDESRDVLDDVRKYWGSAADEWLDSPNGWFDGRKPRELIGTADEEAVRNLIRAIRTGIPA